MCVVVVFITVFNAFQRVLSVLLSFCCLVMFQIVQKCCTTKKRGGEYLFYCARIETHINTHTHTNTQTTVCVFFFIMCVSMLMCLCVNALMCCLVCVCFTMFLLLVGVYACCRCCCFTFFFVLQIVFFEDVHCTIQKKRRGEHMLYCTKKTLKHIHTH